MTLREAIAKAAAQIDAILARRLDALELQLIEAGASIEEAYEPPRISAPGLSTAGALAFIGDRLREFLTA
jgi:hypothetical protein